MVNLNIKFNGRNIMALNIFMKRGTLNYLIFSWILFANIFNPNKIFKVVL